MRAAVGVSILCMFVTLAIVGCATRTLPTLERRIDIRELSADVGPVDNAYQLLVDDETHGRFGCSLAIAKFAAGREAWGLDLVPLIPAEEAHWADIIRGRSELRDLQFLSPISVRPDEPRASRLCAAAEALGASLLLLYAPNRCGANSAQVLGVLYDVKACQPIASLHASARFTNEKDEEVAPDRKRGDRRETDAYYQASRAFEFHVLKCLAELFRNDTSPATTQPHRWSKPPAERWWLP